MTFRLDIHAFPSALLEREQLQRLQDVLAGWEWAEELHIYRYGQEEVPINVHEAGALESAIRSALVKKGPLLPKLREKFGSITRPRFAGSVELRGSNSSLIVVLVVDEECFVRLGDEWRWGNSIGIQVCSAKVERTHSAYWASSVFETLCESLGPSYAHAEMTAEYERQNISREGGEMKAVGLDVSRGLPGLYWLNFFGRRYRDAISKNRLLRIDVGTAKEIADGVLVRIADDPKAWDSPWYQGAARRIREQIGEGHFFTKTKGYGSLLPNRDLSR